MAELSDEKNEIQTSISPNERLNRPLQLNAHDQDSNGRIQIQSLTESTPRSNVVTEQEILSRGCPKAPRKEEETSPEHGEVAEQRSSMIIPESLRLNFFEESSEEDEEITSILIPPKSSPVPMLRPSKSAMQNPIVKSILEGDWDDYDARNNNG